MLQRVDSFSHYTTILDKFSSVSGTTMSIDPTAGPRGAGALKFTASLGSGEAYKAYSTNLGTVIHQFRFKKTVASDAYILNFYDDTTNQLSIMHQGDGHIQIRGAVSHGDFVLAVSASPVDASAWAYLKVKVVIATTTGSVVVKDAADNIVVSFSGTTKFTSNSYVTQYSYGAVGASSNVVVWWADETVMDTTGTYNKDFIGNIAWDVSMPAAAGAHTDWTALTPPNYSAVNTKPPDTSNYVSAAVANLLDSYKIADVPVSAIVGIANNLYCEQTEPGALGIQALFRSGTSEALGTAVAAPSAYKVIQQISETSPATSAPWLYTELNDVTSNRAQFGQKSVAI